QPYTIQSLQGDYPCALSVLPPQASLATTDTVSVVLLVDCSGSMTGLSMQQTQAGLTSLLTSLQDGSEVSLMCFGSNVMHVNAKPLTINTKNRKVLLEFVANLAADMGGTEIWEALAGAQKQAELHQKTPEIIVLTDGQVWENAEFFDEINSTTSEPCRIHSIGIGSAVSEHIVIKLAEATHGQWILVHPNEPMAERIKHFVSQVSAPRQACIWQTENTRWTALPSSTSLVHGGLGYVVYQGDSKPLSISLNGEILPKSELTGELGLALQKLVGQQHVFALDTDEATKLSLKLGLVNRYTSFVMVNSQNVENADGLPELTVVPQMLHSNLRFNRSINENQNDVFMDVAQDFNNCSDPSEYQDIPLFLRNEPNHKPANKQMPFISNVFAGRSSSEDAFESLLLKKVDKKLTRTLLKGRIPSLKILKAWGLNQDIAEAIEAYFIQHNLDDQLCYLAKALLWLNDEQNVLSTASINILQSKIDGSTPSDLAAMDGFIQKLDEVEVCAF
ncbi:VWA domain-containing protein, partial [Aliiglaciecola lipolytica]|uniref:VWA domain-containing protein n=1 Tax=Aliiglaciecola lipolytica TaxID=477689 RepID=UPI00058FB374